MVGSSTSVEKGGYKYYRCNNSFMNHLCSNRKHIKETDIEEYLIENVETLLEQHVVAFKAKEKAQLTKKGNKQKIEKKINRLNELFINGIIDIEELKRRRVELESQIIEDVEQPNFNIKEIETFLNSGFKNIYNDLTLEEKRTLWRGVIKEIHIDGYNIASVIFL